MPDKLLKPEELAARWRVSTSTLADWRWRGKGLPFLKIGGRVFYREEDVRDYERTRMFRDTRGPRQMAGGVS